jgi:hypothetical protein
MHHRYQVLFCFATFLPDLLRFIFIFLHPFPLSSYMSHASPPRPARSAYPPLPYPPPCPCGPSAPPSKPCSARVTSRFFFLVRHWSQDSRHPHLLLSPADVQQVPPLPANNPTLYFLPHSSPTPSQAHIPRLHVFSVFFPRSGTWTNYKFRLRLGLGGLHLS